jgi:hypothetical protein
VSIRALQREADRLPSSRDRAIITALVLAGLRVGDLGAHQVSVTCG